MNCIEILKKLLHIFEEQENIKTELKIERRIITNEKTI